MIENHQTRPRTPRAFGASFLPLCLVAAALFCVVLPACQKDQKIRDRHEEILQTEDE